MEFFFPIGECPMVFTSAAEPAVATHTGIVSREPQSLYKKNLNTLSFVSEARKATLLSRQTTPPMVLSFYVFGFRFRKRVRRNYSLPG